MQHRNAPLTPLGRRRLVALVEDDGLTFEAAAAASNVSRSTVHTWVWRWRRAGEAGRRSLACLEDRSSAPHRRPSLSGEAVHDRICEARRRTGWGPRLIASETGVPHATVSRCLARRGLSRRPAAPKEEVRRFEWPCPGDLLQMDTKRFARFTRPGHAVTGDRYRSGAEKRERVGYEIAHSIVDDHSRLAYTELHRDERGPTVVGFVERAIAFFRAHGIRPRRLQTDNAWTYVKNRALADLLVREGISTARSRRARRGATARWRDISRPSNAGGASGSATSHHGTGPRRCHTGSTTTTTPDATARSATGLRSPAFGTS